MDPRAYAHNKAHAGVYALMHYRLLTLIRKEGIAMGLTKEEIAAKEAEAAKKAEQDVDEAQASNDSDEKTE